MSAASPLPLAAQTLPVIDGHDAASIVGWRHGRAISATEFLDDVARIAASLPRGARHVLNTCADRYRFAVGFAAIASSGRISLLPSTLTAETIAQLKAFAPDAIELTDGEPGRLDLPAIAWPAAPAAPAAPASPTQPAGELRVPRIAADALVAYVFTSGSTGLPVPHAKTWGALVECVRAEAQILGLRDGRRHAIVGTVPPQHMYGFETTVLQPLQNGLSLAAARPLFPADIVTALEEVPRPRVLVTTPFHLRSLLDAGIALPALDLIVSATAPLSPSLAREAEAALAAPLLEIYGSTETGQTASRRSIDGPAWTLFPGVRLVQEDGRTFARGGHVRGTVPLDDVIELIGDERFVLHGRSADMVNIAGKRSSLGFLNHHLCAVPGVVDGAFFAPPAGAEDGVTRLAAAVVAPTLEHATLLRALRARIDPAFLPRRVVFVDRLPRNATGKLPSAALAALFSTEVRVATGSPASTAGSSRPGDSPDEGAR
jgi:acyl-coenzyme A synthetase/AMP-(fatty) acid ligase